MADNIIKVVQDADNALKEFATVTFEGPKDQIAKEIRNLRKEQEANDLLGVQLTAKKGLLQEELGGFCAKVEGAYKTAVTLDNETRVLGEIEAAAQTQRKKIEILKNGGESVEEKAFSKAA